MKENDIQQVLRFSLNNDYVLTNSYIFRWESDYFGISKSGLAYEVEIKTSRADFRADFKKFNKHRELKAAKDKKKYLLLRKYLRYESLKNRGGGFSRRTNQEIPDDWKPYNGYTTDMDVKENEREKNIKLLHSEIQIKELFVPNRFYYAVPKGLIDRKEVPEYAGLIYIEGSQMKKIKEAPVLHKKTHQLTGILLNKFYHLSLNQRNDLRSMQHELNSFRKYEGDIIKANEQMGLF